MAYLEICVPLWNKYKKAHTLEIEVRAWYIRNIPAMTGAKILSWGWRVDYLYQQSEAAYRAYIDARDELDAKTA